jgi:hypothetical protein
LTCSRVYQSNFDWRMNCEAAFFSAIFEESFASETYGWYFRHGGCLKFRRMSSRHPINFSKTDSQNKTILTKAASASMMRCLNHASDNLIIVVSSKGILRGRRDRMSMKSPRALYLCMEILSDDDSSAESMTGHMKLVNQKHFLSLAHFFNFNDSNRHTTNTNTSMSFTIFPLVKPHSHCMELNPILLILSNEQRKEHAFNPLQSN